MARGGNTEVGRGEQRGHQDGRQVDAHWVQLDHCASCGCISCMLQVWGRAYFGGEDFCVFCVDCVVGG